MLWRALSHITRGFYIDVGAHDPLVDSVSRAFHDQGWRGIHVEPVSKYADRLRHQRPGDDVVEAVVGLTQGLVPFFEIDETGLSTANASLADGYSERGFEVLQRLKPSISLDAIALMAERDVHWLKIDVEGGELDVLRSWRSDFRPWILVVESTVPTSQRQSYDCWDDLVVEKDYKFVWFDGLNRFYVHKDHVELEDSFKSPPNVFDGFVLSKFSSSSFSVDIRENIDHLTQEIEIAKCQAEGARSWAEAHLAAVCREKDEALVLAQADRASMEERLIVEIDARDRLVLKQQVASQAAALAMEAQHREATSQWMSTLESEKAVRDVTIARLEHAREDDRTRHQERVARLEADLELGKIELGDVTIAYERTLKGATERAALADARGASTERELHTIRATLLEMSEQSRKKVGFARFFTLGVKPRFGAKSDPAHAEAHIGVREEVSHNAACAEPAQSAPSAPDRTLGMKRDTLGSRKSCENGQASAGDAALIAMLHDMARDIDALKSHVTPPKAELLCEPDSAGLAPRAGDVFGALARAIGPRFPQDD